MIEINVKKQLHFSEGKKQLQILTTLQENTITAFYGDSGAGKTTLLKMLAGLVKPEEGFIKVNHEIWLNTKQNINLPPQQRSIGFVFQDYALFPNMTVLQNLQFAAGKQKDDSFISYLVQVVSLQAFLHTKPSQLSGGQQQRVALIRALVRKPNVLLLDEPLAALSIHMRQSLHSILQQLQKELQFTGILVSHDIAEVYRLASKVIRLEQGEISFSGTPQQLFGSHSVSSKLQLTAIVLSIVPNGVVYIVELLAGGQIVKVTASAGDIADVITGDTVLLYTKAFQVAIKKMM